MNCNINETQKINYSIEDAFQIINSIINAEKQKYENIIITKNQIINELKLELEQQKEENIKYKNKIYKLKNQFISMSNTISQINEESDKQETNKNNTYNKNLNFHDIFKNIEIFNLKKISKSVNNDNNINSFNSTNLNNYNNKLISDNKINNLRKNNFNKQNMSYQQYKKSLDQQLFNKKIIKKLNSFNQRENSVSKSFNYQNNKPIKIIRRNNNDKIKENYSQSTKILNINLLKINNKNNNNVKSGRKSYENYSMQSYTFRKYYSQKNKYNTIERRIKNVKKGLSTKKFNEIGINSKTKNSTYNTNDFNI